MAAHWLPPPSHPQAPVPPLPSLPSSPTHSLHLYYPLPPSPLSPPDPPPLPRPWTPLSSPLLPQAERSIPRPSPPPPSDPPSLPGPSLFLHLTLYSLPFIPSPPPGPPTLSSLPAIPFRTSLPPSLEPVRALPPSPTHSLHLYSPLPRPWTPLSPLLLPQAERSRAPSPLLSPPVRRGSRRSNRNQDSIGPAPPCGESPAALHWSCCLRSVWRGPAARLFGGQVDRRAGGQAGVEWGAGWWPSGRGGRGGVAGRPVGVSFSRTMISSVRPAPRLPRLWRRRWLRPRRPSRRDPDSEGPAPTTGRRRRPGLRRSRSRPADRGRRNRVGRGRVAMAAAAQLAAARVAGAQRGGRSGWGEAGRVGSSAAGGGCGVRPAAGLSGLRSRAPRLPRPPRAVSPIA